MSPPIVAAAVTLCAALLGCRAGLPLPPPSDLAYAGKPLREWVGLLEHPHPILRLSAMRALQEMGPRAEPAIPALVSMLDAGPETRFDAACTLCAIGPAAKAEIPKVAHVLARANGFQRGILGPDMANLGPDAAPALAKLLGGNPEIRLEVILGLRVMGRAAEPAVPALTALLDDPNADIRMEAAYAIWAATGRKDMIDRIALGLTDRNDSVRMGAADALTAIGPKAIQALPSLRKALFDGERSVRVRVATAIGGIGPAASDAVPDLLRSYQKYRTPLGMGLSTPFKNIGRGSVAYLTDALDDQDPSIRLYVTGRLRDIGSPAAQEAIPRLAKQLEDPDPRLRSATALVLWSLQHDKRGLKTYLKEFREASKTEPSRLVLGLQDFGEAAAPAVPDLLDALRRTTRPRDRQTIVETLGVIGPAAQAAVPELRATLKERDDLLRTDGALALWRVARSHEAIETLLGDLRVSRKSGPSWTLKALAKIGPEAAEAVPIIAAQLGAYPLDRYSQVEALEAMGPAAKAAIPDLIAAFNEVTAIDRREIADAINAIDPALNFDGFSRVGGGQDRPGMVQ